MPLTSGTRLGPYRIESAIGAGGMGEVYRAKDTRLGRDVAVKILPAEVAADGDRLRRFEREARAAASLNHANILALYDTGTDAGVSFIVTELLEGRSLRQTLEGERLTIARVIDLAAQVADGLAAAHARGIVHRDIKPENLFITTEGRAKILDFGLAKATDAEAVAQAPTQSATAPNTVLGTAGYMAPEQVRGQPVDHRADIFAFGAVLYEMLSGRRAFQGETALDTMTAILHGAPAPIVSTAERPLPPSLLRIVERCLEKSPGARFQSTMDLAFALKSISGFDSGAMTAQQAEARSHGWRTMAPWAVTTVVVVAAAVGAWRLWPAPQRPRPQVHMVITSGDRTFRTGATWEQFAVASDGSRIVYSLVPPGTPSGGATGAKGPLYVRRFDQAEATEIAGTDGAVRPILSPDGQSVAFSVNEVFKTVLIDGSQPVVLANRLEQTSGWWGPDGILVLGKLHDDLVRLSALPGDAVSAPIARHDPTKGESDYTHPQVLPDGSVLLTILKTDRQHWVGVLPAGSGTVNRLFEGMHPRFVPPGYLIFARGSTLWATAFDLKRLQPTGNAIPVLRNVMGDFTGGLSNFSVSNDGSLAYIPGTVQRAPGAAESFVWLDRQGGHETTLRFPEGQYWKGRISGDARSLVTSLPDASGKDTLWVGDVERGTLTPLNSEDTADYGWSVDGKRVEYRRADGTLWSRPADMSRPETPMLPSQSLPPGPGVGIPSPDGKFRLFNAKSPAAATAAIWIADTPDSNGTVPPLKQLPESSNEVARALSPDGHWLLYSSATSDPMQLYIRPFPGPGGVFPVTTDGAFLPALWTGQDILFLHPGGGVTTMVMAASVETSPMPLAGKPQPLFSYQRSYKWDDTTRDGQRFLFRKDTGAATVRAPATELHVIFNWIEDVKRQLAAAGNKK